MEFLWLKVTKDLCGQPLIYISCNEEKLRLIIDTAMQPQKKCLEELCRIWWFNWGSDDSTEDLMIQLRIWWLNKVNFWMGCVCMWSRYSLLVCHYQQKMPIIGTFSRLFPGILHDPVPGCFSVLLCIFKPCWSKCAFLNHMSMIVNDHNQDQNQMCSNLYL